IAERRKERKGRRSRPAALPLLPPPPPFLVPTPTLTILARGTTILSSPGTPADRKQEGVYPMIKPYTAVGLIPTVRGIRKRADIKLTLEPLSHFVKAASWLSSLDLPVRLIAFPEGALQAFNDEVLDLDHVTFARECAIDIPGEETEALGKIARQYDAFIMAQA